MSQINDLGFWGFLFSPHVSPTHKGLAHELRTYACCAPSASYREEPHAEAQTTVIGPTAPGDRLLLLTDGIYSEVNKREIQTASALDSNFESFCRALVDTVRQRGASDNFTMLAIEFDDADFG